MKKLLLFTLIISGCLNAFGQTEKPEGKKKDATRSKTESTAFVADEEYKIFLAALEKKGEMFVFSDKTDIDDRSRDADKQYGKEFLKELADETFEDFKEKNKESAQIEKKFPTKSDYILISVKDLKDVFDYKFDGEMEWEAFYEKYPKSGGIYTFSRAGFSKDGKQALVFVTNWCRYFCGTGDFFLLNKENGRWKVINKLDIWVS